MRLTVHQAASDDVYKDFVRIPEVHRKGRDGRRIKEGTICRIYVYDGGIRKTVSTVLGLVGETDAWITMDDRTRIDLGVTCGTAYNFEIVPIVPVGRFQQFRWAAVRIAARIGLGAVILGVLGAVLAVLALLV